jgi:hypothetical protein
VSGHSGYFLDDLLEEGDFFYSGYFLDDLLEEADFFIY